MRPWADFPLHLRAVFEGFSGAMSAFVAWAGAIQRSGSVEENLNSAVLLGPGAGRPCLTPNHALGLLQIRKKRT